jgi:WhiB family redox-sensing transcriptional regulator
MMRPDDEAVETGSWQLSGWRTSAACNGPEASLFFPSGMERREARVVRERAAKRICATCPVRSQCLEYALAAQERHGVWGGMTEIERRRLTARRRAG